MRRRLIAPAVLCLLLLTAGCAEKSTLPPPPNARSDGRMRVVATAYPLHEAIAAIGGTRVHSTHLRSIEAGNKPLTATERRRVEEADIILVPGHGSQPEVEALLAGHHGLIVRVLDDFGPEIYPDNQQADPSVWLNPNYFGKVVGNLREVLIRHDPAAAAYYSKNAKNYGRRVADLDRLMTRRLASCERRSFVTNEPRFGYLAQRYGLSQIWPGAAPAGGGDPQAVAIKAANATTLFFSALPSPGEARSLQDKYGIRAAVLDTLIDRSDFARRGGASYVTTMRLNLDALSEALGCEEAFDGK